MKLKRFFAIICVCICFSSFLNSQQYSGQQLIKAGHWIYDAIFSLNAECKMLSLCDNAPLPVSELRIYFQKIDREILSDSGKALYDKTEFFLYGQPKKFSLKGAFAAFNLIVEPEFLYKSNSEIDWNFTTDYTGKVDHYEYTAEYDGENGEKIGISAKKVASEYGSVSSFVSSDLNKKFLSLPVYLGWGEYFMIETVPFVSANYWAMSKNYNFSNIPLSSSDMEFLQPIDAYGSAGYCFNNWGFNIHFAKQGLQKGRSMTGSVIYNNSFETDGYFEFNLYSERLKYNLDIAQIGVNNYYYMHNIDCLPFKWCRIGIVEGTLINEPFELRYINPLMMMHSFGSWYDFSTDLEEKYYGESHVCQYLGVSLDILPVKNLRIYALYAQNEMQMPYETDSISGKVLPDSFAWQVGFELNIPEKHEGFYKVGLEGIYTSPFLYIKQGADWGLYSKRYDMQTNGDIPLYSWIGSPFGPDAVGFEAKFSYEKMNEWKAEFDYLFLAHGTNSFGLLDTTYIDENGKWWAYYPSVAYRKTMGVMTEDEAIERGRSKILTGSVQFRNQVALSGYYCFNRHFRIDAKIIYDFIFNNKNIENNFEQGVELFASLTYNLF